MYSSRLKPTFFAALMRRPVTVFGRLLNPVAAVHFSSGESSHALRPVKVRRAKACDDAARRLENPALGAFPETAALSGVFCFVEQRSPALALRQGASTYCAAGTKAAFSPA